MAELFNEEELRAELRDRIGTQSVRSWARDHGLTYQQVYYCLNGTRPAEPKLLKALGFRRVISYTPD